MNYKNKTRKELHNEAVKKELELKMMMKTGDFSKALRREITTVYFLNNLLLLQHQN